MCIRDRLNAVVLGEEFGNQMRAMFEIDLKGSQEITLDAWQQRPLGMRLKETFARIWHCLLYTSDAADERSSVDLGGRRIIKKKKRADK